MEPEPIEATPAAPWPAHTKETRPWAQARRSGPRADRMFDEVVVSIPPLIAYLPVPLDAPLGAELESAMQEIVALDLTHGAHLEPLATLLLRTESVASSKIEHISASSDDYARALHGWKANPSAVSMVAATRALDLMIAKVGRTRRIDRSVITSAHGALMADDPERDYAGRLRDMQNWIGGSDYSPRDALYVPPPPETVEQYVDDLITFSNRDDIPVLAQAGVAHAQFESIHPFTDGNGRIGRALVNAILRRRGATKRVVVPLASAIVAHRQRYFDQLEAYRAGDLRPIVRSFAQAGRIAAVESQRTAQHLAEVPDQWSQMLGRVRVNSAAAQLLRWLPTQPAFSTNDACQELNAPDSSVYAAVERLHQAGVIRPLTDRVRNQVWGASLILDELDDLGARIERRAR